MATQRAHIILPEDLVKEIDAEVGPRGRSAFLVETARAELRKRRLLAYFRGGKPIVRDEDHPEWADGGAAWVQAIRDESETRFEKIFPAKGADTERVE